MIVVGAGPAGSAAAIVLARAGVDVLLLDKAVFPREKVCGDGLTPRSVTVLTDLGVDVGNGWHRTAGLRVVGGGRSLLLPWPEIADHPPYGLVRRRDDFDLALARRAAGVGARWHQGVSVTGPVRDAAGRVVGVVARAHRRRRTPPPWSTGRLSSSPPTATAPGWRSRPGAHGAPTGPWAWPFGPTTAALSTTTRGSTPGWRCPAPERPLPGYGWVFPMGDGTVNVGLGLLDADRAPAGDGYRALLDRWIGLLPVGYEVTAGHPRGPGEGRRAPGRAQPRPAVRGRAAADR